MAYVYFDSKYAPCSFLIVKDGGDPYKQEDSILIQTDWDYPAIASRMGWSVQDVQMAVVDENKQPAHQIMRFLNCLHDSTDGTIDCGCGVQAGDFISSADYYIRRHQDEKFEELDEYFQ